MNIASPGIFNRRITLSDPDVNSSTGGLKSDGESILYSNVLARIHKLGANQTVRFRDQEMNIHVTHRIFTPQDMSEIRDGFIVTDEETDDEYTIQSIVDETGSGSVWTLYVKENR